jgi:trimethylamine--corrinoid protein Co-methyltransferase
MLTLEASNNKEAMMLLAGKNEEALQEIHDRSLQLISEHGIRFHSKAAREIWHGANAEVLDDVVKIPPEVIESALEKAPGSFTLSARAGAYDLTVDEQHTYYSQDGCAALVIDFETGQRRASRTEDIEKMALISDALDSVDIVSPTVSAQDVPNEAMAITELQACFLNSGKHVLTESVTSARDAQAQIDLAAAVAGDKDALGQRPIFSNFVCTISPLTQDAGGMEAALTFAEAGIPVGIYPMATAGVTSPVTLAATMAVVNAEVISALALLQIAEPGARVFYAGGPATLDLRTGSYVGSSPEALWLRTMVAHMAGYYGLPSIVGAGATSAKMSGPQAGWEDALSFLLPSAAGASVLFGLGLLDGSNLLRYEQIILEAEAAAMVRRMLAGVDFSEDAFALDLIKRLGPGGVFLGQRHTVEHMREALSLPTLSDRDSYEDWYQKGQLSRVDVARRRVEEILRTHQPEPLSKHTLQDMDDVIAEYTSFS